MNDYLDKARLQASIGAEHYAALTLSRGLGSLMRNTVHRFQNMPPIKLSNPIAVDRSLRRMREVLKPISVMQVRKVDSVLIGYVATGQIDAPYFPGVSLIHWRLGKERVFASSPALFMVSSHALGRILERTSDFPVQGVLTILREALPYGSMLGLAPGEAFNCKPLGLPMRGGIAYMRWDAELDAWVMTTFVSAGMLSPRQKEALGWFKPLTMTPVELISLPVEDIPESILETMLAMAELAAA